MYNSLSISENDRILIVAPHPDDETLGCGGILALYGEQSDVLLLTDGRLGKASDGSQSEEETAVIRKKEFEEVMDFFHVRRYKELGICDSQLRINEKKVFTVSLKEYDYIFVPNRNERHPDHKAAHDILKKMHRKQKVKASFLEYEVWSPIVAANRFLDISDVMDCKIEGLLKYRSQIRELDYESLAKGLNTYRGAPHHVAYCEAFYDNSEEQKRSRQSKIERIPLPVRRILISIKRRLKGE